jgi:hypothetical protein
MKEDMVKLFFFPEKYYTFRGSYVQKLQLICKFFLIPH